MFTYQFRFQMFRTTTWDITIDVGFRFLKNLSRIAKYNSAHLIIEAQQQACHTVY